MNGITKLENFKKILLVEDNPFTQFMMKEIIKTLCYEVDVAKNGQEGCERIDHCLLYTSPSPRD